MQSITKQEIVDAIYFYHEISKKDAREILEIILDTIEGALLRQEQVKLRNLGTLCPKKWHGRQLPNIQNPTEKIDVPDKILIKFQPSKRLMDLINSKQ